MAEQDHRIDPPIQLDHPHYGETEFFAAWGGFVHGTMSRGGILEMEPGNFLYLATEQGIELTDAQAAVINDMEANNA